MPRERCIFTAISISLSLGWRQRRCRYTIRAGRNLPDKEFRYLRTVIVTAAVYRGFDQELAPHHLTFRHRAGVTPYTSTFVFAECCVFDKQSQRPGHCGPRTLSSAWSHVPGRTFSRSYGAMLPSSFTRVLSSALGFSPCLPVSDYGTVLSQLKLRGFSWKRGISDFGSNEPRLGARHKGSRICLRPMPTSFPRDNQRPVHLPFSVPPSHCDKVLEY